MSELAERIKGELALLSPEDRAELASFLLHSLDKVDEEKEEDLEEFWKGELERRSSELKSGKNKGIPADQVLTELRKKYS
jgi:putative addiction module component (TIGR02574 family)